ncbi:MAG: tetratricopeptide repeat protein [Armatimonadetes bacterium]|nr:tetratricopeptide repeat protein [Armatimonadota bacterium]
MPDQPAPSRSTGMQPENVAVLVMAALAVGLLLGNAFGRRQKLEVKQVVVEPQAEEQQSMASTAPPAPKTLDEARALVARMGDADAATLLDLGRRKMGNKHPLLAAAFFERALKEEPNHADGWHDLAKCYRALSRAADAEHAEEQARKYGG